MEQEKTQPVAGWPAGVVQHRDVAVGVAAGHDWTPADATPDTHGLYVIVVEHIGLRQVHEVGPPTRHAERRAFELPMTCSTLERLMSLCVVHPQCV